MTRLSEEELGIIQRIGERDKYQRYELVRGYRRAAALEERNEKLRAAIENWCLVESRHHWATEVDAEEFDECLRCGGVGADLHTVSHRDWCLVARSEALLAEGDE